VFLLHPPLRATEGDTMDVSFVMNRSKENHRLLEVEFGCKFKQPTGKLLQYFTEKFYIE